MDVRKGLFFYCSYEEGNYLLTKEPKSQKLNIMKSTTNKV